MQKPYRFQRTYGSIPNISFINRQSVFVAQASKFILKRFVSMMFLLIRNVLRQCINVRRTDRECSVALLPVEIGEPRLFGFDPLRRFTFQITDKTSNVRRLSQSAKKVHMVCHATNNNRGRMEVSARTDEITMRSITKFRLPKKRTPMFR